MVINSYKLPDIVIVNFLTSHQKPSKCAERLGKNEHAFDLEAEPEPIEDAQTETGAADIIDDGYGPVGDDDDDDEAANNSGDSFKFIVQTRTSFERACYGMFLSCLFCIM